MKSLSLTVFTILLSFLSVIAQPTVYCVDLHQTDFEHYDLLNQDIEDKKIIMIGEEHHMAANSIIQAELFIHLNKHYGVRHLLIELGHAEAYLFNHYLQTGNAWYINHTISGFSRSEEFLSNWQKLYDYNAELDSSKKLVVHGIDFEREPGLSASLYKLLSSYESTPQIERLIHSIKIRLDTIGIERRNKEYVYSLRESIKALSLPEDENKKIIDDIIGNDFFLFISVGPQRDQNMAQNFLALDTTDEVYLGQFDFAHTMLNDKKWLTGYLNSLEKYHDKILVMNMFYVDSDKPHPFEEVSDCPVFLYRIDPSDTHHGGFSKRGQWAWVLKDQKHYTQMK